MQLELRALATNGDYPFSPEPWRSSTRWAQAGDSTRIVGHELLGREQSYLAAGFELEAHDAVWPAQFKNPIEAGSARGELLTLAHNDNRRSLRVTSRHHARQRLVSPDRFIPIAEATGDIDAIGSWVLNEAIHQVLDWDRRFGTALDVAINLSPVQLEREGSIEAIASNLAMAEIRPDRVTLELTESAVMKEPEKMIGILTSLKTSGFKIAVDDFGTGYSSLSYLRKLPVDIVKIDKSFVAGIASETEEFALASLIVELTHSLGMTSLAEGIERPEHLAHLRALNCKLGQGYYFSRPLPPEKLEPLLVMPVTSWPQSA